MLSSVRYNKHENKNSLDDVTADSLEKQRAKSPNLRDKDFWFVRESNTPVKISDVDHIHKNVYSEEDVKSSEDRINWALNHSPDFDYSEYRKSSSGISSITIGDDERRTPRFDDTSSSFSCDRQHHTSNDSRELDQENSDLDLTKETIKTMKDLKDFAEVARVIDEVDDEEWLLMFIGELETILSDVIKTDLFAHPVQESPSRSVKKKKTLLYVARDLLAYLRGRCDLALTRHNSERDHNNEEEANTMHRMKELASSRDFYSMNKWQRKLSVLATSLDKYLNILTSCETSDFQTHPSSSQPNANHFSSCQSNFESQLNADEYSRQQSNFEIQLKSNQLPICQSNVELQPNSKQQIEAQFTPNQVFERQPEDSELEDVSLTVYSPQDLIEDLNQEKQDSNSSMPMNNSKKTQAFCDVTESNVQDDVYRYYVEVDTKKLKPSVIDFGDVRETTNQYRATRYVCPRKANIDLNSHTSFEIENNTSQPSTSFYSKCLLLSGSSQTSLEEQNNVIKEKPDQNHYYTELLHNQSKLSINGNDKSSDKIDILYSHGQSSNTEHDNLPSSSRVPIPKQRSKTSSFNKLKQTEDVSSERDQSEMNTSQHVSEWKGETQKLVRVEPLTTLTSSVQCDIVSTEAIRKSDAEMQKLRKSAEMLRRGITEAREERDEKERKITILDTKVQRLKKSIESGRIEKGSASEELEKLKKILADERRNNDLEVEKLSKRCKSLEDEEKRLQHRVDDLEEWIENMKKENEMIKERCTMLEEEKKELEQKICDTTMALMNEKRHNRRLNVENVDLEMKLSQLMEEMEIIQRQQCNETKSISNNRRDNEAEEFNNIKQVSEKYEEEKKKLKILNNKLQQKLSEEKKETEVATDCFRQQIEFLSSEVSIQRHTIRTQKENYERELHRLFASKSAEVKPQDENENIPSENAMLRSQLVYQETLTRTLYSENERLRDERDSLKTKSKFRDEENKPETQDFSCQMDDLTYTKMRAHDFYLQEAQRNARRLKERGSELRLRIKEAEKRNRSLGHF